MSDYFKERKSDKVRAMAIIEIVLEVPAHSTWGGDVELKQIHSQASKETLNDVLTTLRTRYRGVRVIGEAKVRTVMTQEV